MTPRLPIYLDHHATTPVDPAVLEAMLPYFRETFGNASSRNHPYGWAAQKAVDCARAQVAAALGCLDKEIVFTSGATESNNLALKGAAETLRSRGNHIISAVTEHKSVLDPLRRLERGGVAVTWLPVDSTGRVDPEAVRAAIGERTILISVMAANNEVGTLQPVEEIGRIAKERGVLFHCDAAQAVGKVPVDVARWGVDLLSLSGHKLYGPKGIGVLYVRSSRPRVRLTPLLDGGGHERGLRSGTLNVPGCVGLGRACEIAGTVLAGEADRLKVLRDRLQDGIMSRVAGVTLNGPARERLPGNLNLSFEGVDGEALMMGLTDIALSSGSACTSASLEPSYVLRAMGVPEDLAHASLRFGLGRTTTEDEIDHVIARVTQVVGELRNLTTRNQGPAEARTGPSAAGPEP